MRKPVSRTECPKCGRKTDPVTDYRLDRGRARAACKVCDRQQGSKSYRKHREKRISEAVERKRLDPAAASRDSRNYRQRLRQEVLTAYAVDGAISCKCCGENEEKFLAIDHVNDDGSAHRKTLKNGASGNVFYKWLRDNGWPPGFQILCHNCNFAKSAHGVCPHQAKSCHISSNRMA
jgi:transcription elongation factor Elf1